MRIVYQVQKGVKAIPRVTLYGSLPAGAATLFAPRELQEAVAALMDPPQPGTTFLQTGAPQAQPLDFYQGAGVTVSVDSASLASGRFIGADTQALLFPDGGGGCREEVILQRCRRIPVRRVVAIANRASPERASGCRRRCQAQDNITRRSEPCGHNGIRLVRYGIDAASAFRNGLSA